MGLGAVQGKSAAMVEKEVVLATVADNLIVQVRRLAAEKAGVSPRRLSFKGVQSLLKAFQTKIAVGNLSVEELQQQSEKLLRAYGQRKLPNRRKAPRELIPRRRRYPERPHQPEEGSRPPGAGAFDTSPERLQRSPQSRPPKNPPAAARATTEETKCPKASRRRPLAPTAAIRHSTIGNGTVFAAGGRSRKVTASRASNSATNSAPK